MMENQLPKYLQDIVDKLPLEVEVTQEMIVQGTKRRSECAHCIGARMLASILPEGYTRENHISWGVFSGYIGDMIPKAGMSRDLLYIKSDVNVYMMVRPQKVTLSLVEIIRK